jgi:hypothetical protein
MFMINFMMAFGSMTKKIFVIKFFAKTSYTTLLQNYDIFVTITHNVIIIA